MNSFWQRIEERRAALGLSRAEMCRRAGISESTATKAVARGSKPLSAVRRQIETVLKQEAQSQNGGEAA